MSDTAKLILFVFVIAAAMTLSCRNYRECRQQGFSARYCTTTHLLR